MTHAFVCVRVKFCLADQVICVRQGDNLLISGNFTAYGRCFTRASGSVQCWRVVIIARFEVLRIQYLKAKFGLNTIKDHGLVYALRNRDITIGAVVVAHAKWISGFPERFIVKCLKPFLKVGSIFKLLHGFSVSQVGFSSQKLSLKGSTWRFEPAAVLSVAMTQGVWS